MKTNYILTIAMILYSFSSFSQVPDWQWAKAMGGTSYDDGQSIALDPAGGMDVYTTGSFSGTVDFDPDSAVNFNLTSAGGTDIFISKLDSSGNFVWAKAMGGTYSEEVQAIAIDPAASRDVYTTGSFGGTADFDPDSSGTFNLTAIGFHDLFISKLDSAGNFVWAKVLGGANQDVGLSIALDPAGSGDVYTTGSFQGTVDFDPGAGTFNLTATGFSDIFILKLDASGNFVWAKAMGGATDYGRSIALDPTGSGDVYTTGYFSGTADFDPSAAVFNLTSSGFDIFISKLNSSGNFVWAKAMNGNGNGVSDAYSIALDPTGTGDIYTTGVFEGTVDFDPDSAVNFNLTSAGGTDIFISKLDSSGNFVWAKALGGTSEDWGLSVALDPTGSGEVYTTGYFKGVADFDPGVGNFNLTSAGGTDIFISKLDGSGNFVWAKAIGGSANYDYGQSIALDGIGHVFVTGHFQSPTITFDSTTLANADNSGTTTDVFIAKLEIALITGNIEIENLDNGILLFPNPATNQFTIAFESCCQKVIVTIADVTGKIIYRSTAIEGQKIEVNANDFTKGVYAVQIQSADFIEAQKLIVVK